MRANRAYALKSARDHPLTASDNSVGRAVSAVLLGSQHTLTGLHLTPGRSEVTQYRLGRTVASTGTSVIRRALARPQDADELRHTRSLRSRAGHGASTEFTWDEAGWLTRDYTGHQPGLATLERHQDELHSPLNALALLSTPLLSANLLALASGKFLIASDLPGLRISDARVRDVMEIGWNPGLTARFRYRGAPYPLPPTAARSFRKLCDILIANYPALFHHHQPDDELGVSPPSSTIWRVRLRGAARHLIRDPGPAEADLGPAPDILTAEKMVRRATGHTILNFVPHPLLSPILPLWGGHSSPSHQHSTPTPASDGTSQRQERSHQAQHPEIASALQTIMSKEIHGSLGQGRHKRSPRVPPRRLQPRAAVYTVRSMEDSSSDQPRQERLPGGH